MRWMMIGRMRIRNMRKTTCPLPSLKQLGYQLSTYTHPLQYSITYLLISRMPKWAKCSPAG